MHQNTIAVSDLLTFLKNRGVHVAAQTLVTEPDVPHRGRPRIVAPPNVPSQIAHLYHIGMRRLQKVINRIHQEAKEARRTGKVRSADRYAVLLADRRLRPFLLTHMGIRLPANYFQTHVFSWRRLRAILITKGHDFTICGKHDGKILQRQIEDVIANIKKDFDKLQEKKLKQVASAAA